MKKLIILLLLFNQAYANSYTWNVNAGNWNNPANWLPASVPKVGDDVVINSAASITVDTTAHCKSITISAPTTITCSWFLSTGLLTINANLDVEGPQQFTCTGMTSFGYNISLINNGKMNFTGGITMGGDSLNTITNTGTITVTNCTLTYGSQSSIINRGAIRFNNAPVSGPVGSFIFNNIGGAISITGNTVDLMSN